MLTAWEGLLLDLEAPRKEIQSFLVSCPRELLSRPAQLRDRVTAWKTYCKRNRQGSWCGVMGNIPQVERHQFIRF